MDDVATLLGRLIQRCDLSVRQVASKSGVAVGTLENWLDRTTPRPRRTALLRVLVVLNADHSTIDQVLAAAGHPNLRTLAEAGVAEAKLALTRMVIAAAPIISPIDQALGRLAGIPRRTIPRITPLPRPSRVALPPNDVHVGRDTQLKQIAGLLAERARQPIVISGAGGMGKTTLANEIAHRYGAFFAGGVWWISCADPTAIPFEIAACGGTEGLDLMPGVTGLSLPHQVALVQDAWASPLPRLVILDGCEDPALPGAWLPRTGGCRVVVTTRHQAWGGIVDITLREFDRPTSIRLLQHHGPGVTHESAVLDAIAGEVGDMPLALQMAGRYLQRYRYLIQPGAYLTTLRTQPLDQALAPVDAERPLYYVVDTSLRRLDLCCPVDALAERVLQILAWGAAGDPAPRSLLQTGGGEDTSDPGALLRLEEAIIRLAALGLVSDQGDVRIHPLLARLVRERLGPAVVPLLIPPLITPLIAANRNSTVAPMRPWLAHLQALAEHAVSLRLAQAGELCQEIGHQLWLLGAPSGAIRWLDQALALAAGANDPAGIDAALNLLSLAQLLQGNYAEGERLSRERLARLPASPCDARHGEELNNLGYALMLQGRYAESLAAFRQSLAVRRHVHGPFSQQVARVLHNLGYLAFKSGRLARAWRLLLRALVLRVGLNAPVQATGFTICTLGEVALARGDLSSAHALFTASLEVRQTWYTNAHDATAESQYLLACAHISTGDLPTAADLLARAATATRQGLGPIHRQMVFVLTGQARLALAGGDVQRAQGYLDEALVTARAILGDDHPETATVWFWQGLAAEQTGDLPRAIDALRTAHRIRETLWRGNYQRGDSAVALGRVLALVGDYEDARTILHAVSCGAQQARTDAHPAFQDCADRLRSLTEQPAEA